MSKSLLWLGAGEAKSPTVDYNKYDKVILVDPLLRIDSSNLIDDTNKVVMLNKAVAINKTGKHPFNVFNNEEYSSFLSPAGLQDIYPNLEIEDIESVETIAVERIIDEYRLDGKENTLILDFACLSGHILEQLKNARLLSLFNTVFVSAGKIPLYENTNDIHTILKLLTDNFYQHVEEYGDDPDVCAYKFCFNPLLEEVAYLQNEVLDLKAQIKLVVQTNQDVENEKDELKVLLSNSQTAFAELKKELQQANSHAEALKAGKSDIEHKFKETKQQLENEHTDNRDLKGQLEAAQEKVKSLEDVKRRLKEQQEQELEYQKSLKDYAEIENSLKAKLEESEEKQKETYSLFSAKKQEVETLSAELESLKRENALLVNKNDTSSAIADLEQKLTSMLERQNDDSIEIANALGKHITRCNEEQKSNIASQFELRKLSVFSQLPVSYSQYSMDPPNLAELSTLVSTNNYDVIIEFGSGLSTIVAAGAIHERFQAKANAQSYSLEDSSSRDELSNALPKHIVSFEHSNEWLEHTNQLLLSAGLGQYVDLYHAPLVSVPDFVEIEDGNLFYDCTEKLLELKRIFNNRKAKLLIIVDGPASDKDSNSNQDFALPLLLNYLSQCDVTFFLNNANLGDKKEIIGRWKDEVDRRQLHVKVKQLETPKGATIVNIQS